jgi:hypothetical protein
MEKNGDLLPSIIDGPVPNAFILDIMKLLLEAFGRGIVQEEPNPVLESPLSAPVCLAFRNQLHMAMVPFLVGVHPVMF